MEYARDQTGRPAHLLEKDVWVVCAAMLDDAILLGDPATFDQLTLACTDIEGKISGRDV